MDGSFNEVRAALERWAQDINFKSTVKQIKVDALGKDIILRPVDLVNAYLSALQRMSITLNENNSISEFFGRNLLSKSDADIDLFFQENNVWDKYCVVNLIQSDPTLRINEMADRFFYGSFDFPLRNKIRRIENSLSETFFRFLYYGQVIPDEPVAKLGVAAINRAAFKNWTTNYLLRNFWHNFVHTQFQKITSANYHDFSGQATYSSDFEADNISYLLLARSYALPVMASGFPDERPSAEIHKMLRQNRCNRIFEIRAKNRNSRLTAQDEYQDFESREWRRRRSIAGYLSGYLLSQGRVVTTLNIDFIGNVSMVNGKLTRHISRVIADLNGVRISKAVRKPHEKWTREDFLRFIKNLAPGFHDSYQRYFETEPELKIWAEERLESLFKRIGLSI